MYKLELRKNWIIKMSNSIIIKWKNLVELTNTCICEGKRLKFFQRFTLETNNNVLCNDVSVIKY
jgi:hypothetical protein